LNGTKEGVQQYPFYQEEKKYHELGLQLPSMFIIKVRDLSHIQDVARLDFFPLIMF